MMMVRQFVSSGPYLRESNFAGLFFCRQVESIEEAGITLFLFLLSFSLSDRNL
jgi:hypothetical protein